MPNTEEVEFGIWLAAQSSERIQVAFARAAREFDSEHEITKITIDNIEDTEFLGILTGKLNDLWNQDALWELQRRGYVTLGALSDGSMYGAPTAAGEVFMDRYETSPL